MKVLNVISAALFAFTVGIWTAVYLGIDRDAELARDTRVRYPNEQAIAKKMCGKRRLMYWWIGDPRKGSATMTVRCTGVVTVKKEVKF